MSLILDALRKSEAERRRGQAPDLYAELPPLVPRTAPRRAWWPWWLAGGLAVLAALWLLRGMTPLAAAVTTPVVESSAPIAVDTANDPAPITATAPVTASPSGPAAAVATAPARLEPRSVREATATVTVPPPPVPASPSPAPALLPPPQAPVPVQAPAQPPQQVASVTPPPPAATPLPAPAAAAPLRLADLSAGEREQLPALKISMHMWGPNPDQRFAIIDGARVGQGDRVGDAVVEEIAADSVVLNWHGQRVALPIH